MNANAAAKPSEPGKPADEKTEKKDDNFVVFVLKLVAIVLIFRSFIFSPFSIPSESMLPGLMKGDYLLAAKWPYGYSRYSLPLDAPLIPGRIFADAPERGDVIIFKHPVDGSDYIKRAIALPGDAVAVRGGVLMLNGQEVERRPVGKVPVRLSENTDCHPAAEQRGEFCYYTAVEETLPSGRKYEVIDLGTGPADDFGPVIVPEGHVFAMGDNRDNSLDSRFPAEATRGIGMVPLENLVGRATIIMWSTDGSAQWLLPWTWFTALRWDRLGDTL